MYLLLILYTGFCPDFFEDNTEDDTEEGNFWTISYLKCGFKPIF